MVCIASSTTGFHSYTSTHWHLDKSQMTLVLLDPKAILCIFYWTPSCWFLCPPSNPSLHGSCDPGLSLSPTYLLCHSLPSLPFVTYSLFPSSFPSFSSFFPLFTFHFPAGFCPPFLLFFLYTHGVISATVVIQVSLLLAPDIPHGYNGGSMASLIYLFFCGITFFFNIFIGV